MGLIIFLVIFYLLVSASLYFLFPKAGVDATKALIPGVNFAEVCKLIGKKPSHALWLLFPIVNIFIFAAMAVDLVRSFGKLKFKHTAAAVIVAPAIFYKTAVDGSKYEGPILPKEAAYHNDIMEAVKRKDQYNLDKLNAANPYKKSMIREWTESIVFAVFAASFIRMFLIEAFVIPTPSMEGSLNVGDYLFVSKAHYGIRTPETVFMIPLLHNRIPFINKESYLSSPSLNPVRLPAIEKIEVGKPIVFNWPVGDSVYLTSRRSYFAGQEVRNPQYLIDDPELKERVDNKEIIVRPIDKKDHYIKRCIGIGGDKIEIKDKQVYVNDKPMLNPKHLQFIYIVSFSGQFNNKMLDKWGIDQGDFAQSLPNNRFALFLDDEQVEKLKGAGAIVEEYNDQSKPGSLFPFDMRYGNWTVDNYGPIFIPKQGQTMALDTANISFYQRAIAVYEKNDLKVENNKIIINGKEVTAYTFKQDYYWAMGDNRHNSEDSRMWGFVPHDHIVGKPLFIWFSTKEGNIKDGINWDRIFKYAGSKE